MTLQATDLRAGGPSTPAGPGPTVTKKPWRRRGATWFLLPAIAFVVLFFGFPLVYNLVMSVLDYTVQSFYTGEAPFVGTSNYAEVFGDALFPTAVSNTIIFTVGSITFQFVIGMALALYFNQRFPLAPLLRALILLPWLLPLVVSGAVWRWMFDQDLGVVNFFLQLLPGVDTAAPWLTQGGWALAAVIIANIWIGIPFNFILLHGGLQAIPQDINEAAGLDGATGWRRFRHITWPLLRPVTSVVLLLGLVYTIKVFDVIMVITGGGPANATQTLTTWSYQLSFGLFKFGPGAAVSTLLVLVAVVLGLVYLRTIRTEEKAATR